jgi:hypothetical protein
MCGISAVSMFGEREQKKRENLSSNFGNISFINNTSWNTFCIIYVIIYSSSSKLEKKKKKSSCSMF